MEKLQAIYKGKIKKSSYHTLMPKEKKHWKSKSICTLIWDIFQCQKKDEVTSLFVENKIVHEYVPHNMTADFQILDLTDNDPVDTGRKLNVLCTFNLRPVSRS